MIDDCGVPDTWLWDFSYISTVWIQTQDPEDLYQATKQFVVNTAQHQVQNPFDQRISFIALAMSPTNERVKNDVLKRVFIPGDRFYTPENLYNISKPLHIFLDRLIEDGVDTSGMTGWLVDFPTFDFVNKTITN